MGNRAARIFYGLALGAALLYTVQARQLNNKRSP